MSKIGFDLAAEVKPYDYQFDLEEGQKYKFNGDVVILDRIIVTPSFELHKTWYGKLSYKPTYRIDVAYTINHGPNSLIIAEHCLKPIDVFISGLEKYSSFKGALYECWRKIK